MKDHWVAFYQTRAGLTGMGDMLGKDRPFSADGGFPRL